MRPYRASGASLARFMLLMLSTTVALTAQVDTHGAAGEQNSRPGAGAIPRSLQEKLPRLKALSRMRQQEGADLRPVVRIAEGIGPLMEQGKYLEAEALVDRAMQLLGGSPEMEGHATTSPREPRYTAPENAQPFPCPVKGTAIELASGSWFLGGDCTVNRLTLQGDAQLWVKGLAFTVAGNIELRDNAGLHIQGGSFTIANQFKLEYHIEAKGKALLEIRDAKVSTNAGVTANLTSSYDGSDDSRLHIENVEIDRVTSWLLCNLRDRASVETKDSRGFPTEIYPTGNATVRIEGHRSRSAVWLHFLPGSSAELNSLPSSEPFTFSFGRNTPGVQGIGYQVDVVDGNANFSISSFPRSNVTVRNSQVGLGYEFSDVTVPERLTGLKPGRQTATFRNQGRVLDLQDAQLPPFGWQLYSSNAGVALPKVAPVTVTNALINEMGASMRGWFEADRVQFAFAAIAAVGPGSRVHIRNSVINSHTIMGNSDGVVTIEDSEIFGSRVQAVGHSRILLLNTALKSNERNPKCIPLLPSLNGVPPARCNPYNPAHDAQFLASGDGAIWVAGIDRIPDAVRSGSTCTFAGDAMFQSAARVPYTYNLSFGRPSDAKLKAIVTGGAGPKRGEPLGHLDTKGFAPGDYIVELKLIVPGRDPVAVRRSLRITAQ